jgi:alpha-beta hydrolase superfamily lysophospholipase
MPAKADTRFFSEMAIEKANERRELFLIDGATHVSLYDKKEYVDPAVEKMNSFFKQYLEKPLHTKAGE